MIDIDFKLQQWGQWSRKGNPMNKLDYPAKSTCAGLVTNGHDPDAIPDMSDDEAMQLDALIANLKRRNGHERRILEAIYINRLSIRATAKIIGIGKSSVCRELHRAKEYLEKFFTN